MGNVIDIRSRLIKQKSSLSQNKQDEKAGIVDIGVMREKMITDDRRQVRRTILTEFISVHTVVPDFGLLRVILYDINVGGLSFDLEKEKGHYNIGDEIDMRIYLNHYTYFSINAKVAHITEPKDEGITRHGCEFVKNSVNSEALFHFVKFLESVTASLRRDGGEVLVTKINS